MAWYWSLTWTIILLVLSAFFVAIEFSLLSARRHRLEEQAETSAAARAGLRSLNELTMMLAGAQLGITAVTFALGAITKPWVHHMIEPLLEQVGLPAGTAGAVSFLLALFIVTFIHLVVGEMAPKSWAIAHPETALRIIAVPARWFVTVFRPLLAWINRCANRLVRLAGQDPVDRAAAKGYTTEMLHNLVQHSLETGALDADSAKDIEGIIALESSNIGEAVKSYGSPARELPVDATIADVHRVAREQNFLRIFITDPESVIPNVVYIRDTTLAAPTEPAVAYAHPPQRVTADTPIADVLDLMRETQEQIVVVLNDDAVLGIITWDDIMNQLWPEIEDQLDRAKN
ncbi:CNNM domain-containing protein [Corynebacterium uterequi]|uniref:CBS domain-containing protein n=1 Tax=Corynebacterium uterequi TaxID=1072256 RepID=A0A0G3HFP2_9CORY|nr:hemolysin family protein [Corynebacterium uterequi]AKK11585.1 CBS domain-containing protein [Corynebacterium uterequi]